MVGMLMGDEYGGKILGSKALLCQRPADSPAGDTHVNEQVGIPAGEKGSVS